MNTVTLYNRQDSPRANASRQAVVERAEAFLRAHVGESVPLVQLCRVVGLSERSLRNAFYDARGMSPKRCVLRERLHEARRALRGTGAKRATVTNLQQSISTGLAIPTSCPSRSVGTGLTILMPRGQ